MRVGDAAASVVVFFLPRAGAGASFWGAFSRNTRSIAQRNAESVLPEPVGATTSACLPAEIASHAPICALVGWAKAPRNQSWVAGENRSSTSLIPTSSPRPPTSGRCSRPAITSPGRGSVAGLRDEQPEQQVEPDGQA